MKAATQQAIEAGHDEECAGKVVALCQLLDCTPEDIETTDMDHYGMPVYEYAGAEYAVGTEDEADNACTEYVRDSVWAFNASFILSRCELPKEFEEVLRAFQEKKCEDANPTLLALVERLDGLDNFVDAATTADGRGHFLSGYDGIEQEQTVQEDEWGTDTFYIYRTN